jgi:hypothetical protein
MNRDLIVLDAVVAWRDKILQRNVLRKSKVGYLSHMVRLIEKEVFDIEQPLSEFFMIKLSDKIKKINNISEWSASTKQARQTLFRSFYKFAKRENIAPTDIISDFTK